jgi:hypothetical protein
LAFSSFSGEPRGARAAGDAALSGASSSLSIARRA